MSRRNSPNLTAGAAATMLMVALVLMVVPVRPVLGDVQNLTGLPLYPNLTTGVMNPRLRTDTLGHWCSHFSAETTDSIAAVEVWYRKALLGSSETDLSQDRDYRVYSQLTGVKLAIGIDSIAVYKTSRQAPTSIELSRCSPRT